ncbi:hypothetical protein B0H16DRAFT_1683178 [Mycena metata]|uniref:Uncharacterized protein n=1 Tax=Mycena metata TaxID=1033252 RepID=A0AAD7K7F0_9AGAR|nr:hypothetical protein B0H16DRAFT_1683178 [Mycena metata]
MRLHLIIPLVLAALGLVAVLSGLLTRKHQPHVLLATPPAHSATATASGCSSPALSSNPAEALIFRNWKNVPGAIPSDSQATLLEVAVSLGAMARLTCHCVTSPYSNSPLWL